MSKVKVIDLAKEIDKPSKELVMYLREKGFEVTNHLSVIDVKEQNVIFEKFAPDRVKKETPAAKPAAKKPAVKNTSNDRKDGRPKFDRQSPDYDKPRFDRQSPDYDRPRFDRQSPDYDRPRNQRQNTENKTVGSKLADMIPDIKFPEYVPEEKPVAPKKAENKPVVSEKQEEIAATKETVEVEKPVAKPEEKKQEEVQFVDVRQIENRPADSRRNDGKDRPRSERGTDRQGGDRPRFDRNSDRPSGDRPRFDRNSDRPNGDRPRFDRNSDRPNGDRPRFDRNSDRPSGDRTGGRPMGARPAGARGDNRGFDNRGFDKDKDDDSRNDRRQGGAQRRGQGGRGLSIPDAPKDDRITKTSSTRDKSKEKEREREKERDRNERSQNKRFDKKVINTGLDDEEFKRKKKDPNRKGAFIKPEPVAKPAEPEDGIKTIVLPESLTIKDLAEKMKLAPAALVKKLFLGGKMYSINQEITYDEAEEIALEFNCIAEPEEKVDAVAELLKEEEENEADMVKRPPVVCVMGHVDHGKTSLLDAIRETNVTSREAGGITQHIGAYTVEINGRKITFLDTPGHEAFTSMRLRGAQSTDIAILVVAADDGVMPQTIEAISHARAANIDIIVAINKIDKPGANLDRVKQELAQQELIAEDWGGSTIFVPVSAKTKEGIDQLLEMILLTADVNEYKANPNRAARGVVIEAQLDKGRGPVATVLVQKGTLHVGESISIGSTFGKVRAMIDDKGRKIKEAGPSTPVEILGLNDVPGAGDIMLTLKNEKEARAAAETFISQSRVKLLDDTKAKLSLDGLFSQIQAGNIKELNLIIKADVQGSVEAVKQSLLKLSNDEVAIRVIHGAVGAINESDVSLASASNAIIIGFNVRPDAAAKDTAEREKVDVRLYKVIYNAIEDIEAAMKGMLDPIFEEKIIGHAEIRQIFKASGIGNIAGSYVLDGKIVRGCKARVYREGELIFEGNLASLKRFKDDVKEVATGYECGLVFEKFNDLKELDTVELYVMEEVPR